MSGISYADVMAAVGSVAGLCFWTMVLGTLNELGLFVLAACAVVAFSATLYHFTGWTGVGVFSGLAICAYSWFSAKTESPAHESQGSTTKDPFELVEQHFPSAKFLEKSAVAGQILLGVSIDEFKFVGNRIEWQSGSVIKIIDEHGQWHNTAPSNIVD